METYKNIKGVVITPATQKLLESRIEHWIELAKICHNTGDHAGERDYLSSLLDDATQYKSLTGNYYHREWIE